LIVGVPKLCPLCEEKHRFTLCLINTAKSYGALLKEAALDRPVLPGSRDVRTEIAAAVLG